MSKEEYAAWEARVIDAFFRSAPENVRFTGNKVRVFAYVPGHMAAVQRGERSKLPAKTKISMHHMGKGEMDGVSSGLKDGSFLYPATDTGGLTNVKHALGERLEFAKPSDPRNVSRLYAEWKRLSGKRTFFDGRAVRRGLSKWLGTLPPKHSVGLLPESGTRRAIVPASRVLERTGAYYLRVYGGDAYARRVTRAELTGVYACVESDRVVPNYNERNIRNENVPGW